MAAEAVKVIVRCRPMNEREINLNSEAVVSMDSSIIQVELKKPKSSESQPKKFTFDGVYYMKDTTKQLYDDICFPLVSNVLEGYNGTVFAYGQTGSGKSYTMMGVADPPENVGVIPRAFGDIFDHIAVNTSIKFLVRASYLEIYNEEVRDLLGKQTKKKLDLHEHPDKGVYVEGLSYHKVQNISDLQKVMELGNNNRSVGATLMNVDSSRSHSIFCIDIEMIEDSDQEEGPKLRAGKLNLVDLAGSERQAKTGATGDRLKEATKINLSLSALGNVISALVDSKSKHIPYRDSKLTRLLQSSLGGNTKTLMVACISPSSNNYDETLSTLRYANRAKNIKNKPKINEDPKDALLREYQEEIKKLKMMLAGQNIGELQQPTVVSSGPSKEQLQALEREKEAIKNEYESRIKYLKEEFGQEKADRKQLQKELEKLKAEQNVQLSEIQNRLEGGGETGFERESYSGSSRSVKNSGNTNREGKMTPIDNVLSGKDRAILNDQAKALKRLEELQNELIGGERAADESLKKELEDRRQAAAIREKEVVTSNWDDDGVIENVFNSITEEVRFKTRLLETNKEKLNLAREEISDLTSEFETDRQDYLDTIRKQNKTIKLYEQLLGTVVPCLRRDCNYFNLDKIKLECVWSENEEKWVLPKLTISRTSLSPVVPSSSGNDVSTSSKEGSNSSLKGNYSVQPSAYDAPEEDKYLTHLQRSDNSMEYFKPKRALELLQSSRENVSTSYVAESGSKTSLVGLSNQPMYGRKPQKLESLPQTKNPSPKLATPPEPPSILEKVEKKLSNKKKTGLKPLNEDKKRD